jgi:V/A-type H+/Na+-transporting ATPase subunit I
VSIKPITKALFVVHRDEKSSFLKFVQEQGTVQITELAQQDVRAAFPGLCKENSRKLNDLMALTSQIELAIGFLSPYAAKRSLVTAMTPRGPRSTGDLSSLADSMDIREILESVMRVSRELSEARSRITRLESAGDTLVPWLGLDAPVESIRDSKKVHQMLFVIFRVTTKDLLSELNSFGDTYALTPVSVSPNYSYYHFVCHADDRMAFNEVLAKLGAQREGLPEFEGTFKEGFEDHRREIREIGKRIADLEKNARMLAGEKEHLEALYDHYVMERQREEVSERLDSSAGAAFIEGWIPADKVNVIREAIRERFTLVEMATFDHNRDDKPPILLQNSKLIRPFEVITSLYGMPDSREFDPTPFYALFYAIFFGTCLTDAGYGIVLSIILFFLIFRFRYSLGRNKLVQVLLIGSVATVFLGAITGGWFGDLLFRLPEGSGLRNLGTSIMVMDPLKDTITFMLVCIALGMAQINIGMLIGFAKLLKINDYRQAMVKMAWIVFINTAALLIAEYMSPGIVPQVASKTLMAVIVMASLVIVFFSEGEGSVFARVGWGLYNLYGCTGYVGDVLSYLRLLALGLSTGIIASVVNLVADLVGAFPYVGPVLATIVFIGGHAFNISINCLGAFVHTTRLQYVEFFNKFYDGTGKPFKPFGISPKYTYLREAID